MEYFQHIQKRANQTIAVANQYLPGLTIGSTTLAQYSAAAQALDGLAQTRDNLIASYDSANNAEHFGFLAIRGMTLSLPHTGESDLSEDVPAEAALIDLYQPVYSYVPRTSELAIQRGQKLVSALNETNSYLAGLTPPRPPITAGGKTVTDLSAALAAQPALEQSVQDAAAKATGGRSALRVAATAVDRLNKRAYQKLSAEARTNPALKTALGQIDTGSERATTLGIKSVLQGGDDQLHVLVSYDNGTFTASATSTIEWMVDGVDTSFAHSAAADPSGNTLGPFKAGQTIKLRSRVKTSKSTTTGSVRTLKLLAPAA